MINRVILVGNVCTDPQVLGQNGTFMKFAIAVNEPYQDQNKEWQTRAHFFNVVRSSSQSGISYLMNNMKKGMKVTIEGELIQNRYNAADGSKRSDVQIRATGIDLNIQRNQQGGYNQQQNSYTPPSNQGQQNFNQGQGAQQQDPAFNSHTFDPTQDPFYNPNPGESFGGEFNEQSYYEDPPKGGADIPNDNY